MRAADTLDIAVAVTNTGDRRGTDVVRLYVSDRWTGVVRASGADTESPE